MNPHGLRHTPLKRACLPFHHFGNRESLRRNMKRGTHKLDGGETRILATPVPGLRGSAL
ncbi:hypothetical protein NSND_61867 [Nitrospira sp. ND1]|nr:hypothetical protein NSND_61867 [Nitrospira sp. ND1]